MIIAQLTYWHFPPSRYSTFIKGPANTTRCGSTAQHMIHITLWYGPAGSCHKQVDQQTIAPSVMNVKKHLGPTVATLQVVVYW